MSQLLYINRIEANETGAPIIDEQHRGLIATVNSLYYFIQKGWGLSNLKPTLLMLEQYVVFHLKTEEGILVENDLPNETLNTIQEYRANFLSQLHDIVANAIHHNEPEELASFFAKWWLGHQTEFHEKLRPYFGQGQHSV